MISLQLLLKAWFFLFSLQALLFRLYRHPNRQVLFEWPLIVHSNSTRAEFSPFGA